MPRRSGRSRSTLVLLVLASVTAITLDFRGGTVITSLRGTATDALVPVRSAGDAVLGPVGDAVSAITRYGSLEDENDRLRARLDDLEGERLRAEDGRAELEALLEANDISRFTDLATVAARVVGAPVSNFEMTVQLDRGSDSGVTEDLAVVTGAGLVGRVVEVSRRRSTVRLMRDASSAVGVRLTSSGDLAVLEGAGADEPLALGLLDHGAVVEPGDLVVTSGVDDSVYPAGIPVGRVARVARTPGQLEPDVDVEPVVDSDRLRFVQILLRRAP